MMTTATTPVDLDDFEQAKRQNGMLHCPNTLIIDAHEVRDESGQSVANIDGEYLQVIAAATNDFVSRTQSGVPIVFGHTVDTPVNEADSPPMLGTAKNFVVGEATDGTPAIAADLTFDGDVLDELGLKGLHNISCEVWIGDDPLIHPISILSPATTPERPCVVRLQRQRHAKNPKRTAIMEGAPLTTDLGTAAGRRRLPESDVAGMHEMHNYLTDPAYSAYGASVPRPRAGTLHSSPGQRSLMATGRPKPLSEGDVDLGNGGLSSTLDAGYGVKYPDRESRWGSDYVRPGDSTASFLRAKQLRQQVEAEQRRREQEEQQASQQRPQRRGKRDQHPRLPPSRKPLGTAYEQNLAGEYVGERDIDNLNIEDPKVRPYPRGGDSPGLSVGQGTSVRPENNQSLRSPYYSPSRNARPQRYEADDDMFLDREDRSSVTGVDYPDYDSRLAGERTNAMARDYIAGRTVTPREPPETESDRADRRLLAGQEARRRPVRHSKSDALTLDGDDEMQNTSYPSSGDDLVARLMAALMNTAEMRFVSQIMQQNEADRDAMYDNIGEESMASLGDSEEFVEDDADGFEGGQLRRYERGSTPSGTNTFTASGSGKARGDFGRHGPGGNSTRRMAPEGRYRFTDSIPPTQQYDDAMQDLIENPHGDGEDDAMPKVTKGPIGGKIEEAYRTPAKAVPRPGDYSEEDEEGLTRGDMWAAIEAIGPGGSADDFKRTVQQLKQPQMKTGTPRRYQRDPIAAAAASAGIDSKERMWAAVATAQQHSDTVGGQRDVYREIASVMTPTPRRIRRQRVPVGPPPMSREQMYAAVRAATAAGADKATQTQAYRDLVG